MEKWSGYFVLKKKKQVTNYIVPFLRTHIYIYSEKSCWIYSQCYFGSRASDDLDFCIVLSNFSPMDMDMRHL